MRREREYTTNPEMRPQRVKKPNGYWYVEDNVERELQAVIVTLGEFPSQKQMVTLGVSSLMIGIAQTGGVPYWRDKLGYASPKKERRFWEKRENIRTELED